MTYPKLEISKNKLYKNSKRILDICEKNGIELVGVIKGVNGLDEVIKILIDSGFKILASSRLKQLKRVKEIDNSILTYDLRIPMLSEVKDVIRWSDISLNSSIEIIRELNKEAEKQNKKHNIILMVECGDLREGIYDEKELLDISYKIEKEFKNLYLMGIGTNLGCYGSIKPTPDKMNELICKANKVSRKIGRKLEVVSGAASTAFPLVVNGTMPKGITQLRIGDALYVSDLDECFNYEVFKEEDEAFILKAEIIEVREKPSYPIGEITVDAFGNKKEYKDKGLSMRALIAVGRQDLGDCLHLRPLDKQIDVLGGSSDHTILDITNCEKIYRVGDIVEFYLMYENLMMLTQSEYVEKEFI